MPNVIFLMGPTASGKTDLAMRLADQFPVDIISVDSAMIYRRMDIGTAKPDVDTLKRYPHALVDIKDPAESYSAADFCADATRLIEASFAANRIPLLVGGTMMYFKALRDGLAVLPKSDPIVRARLQAEGEKQGYPALHAQLKTIDPLVATKIKDQDQQRILRALEVFELSGKTMSDFWAQGQAPLAYPLTQIALVPKDRAKLHANIAKRFDQMLEAGFMSEMKPLFAREDLHADLPSMRCVGYRQAWQYLSGAFDLNTCREKAIVATRQLAKRQMTWLRGFEGVHVFDPYHSDPFEAMSRLLKPE